MRKFDDSEIANNALSQDIWTESLESLFFRLERSDDHLSWTRLMEWFVEAVIGAELFRNDHPSTPPLSLNDVRIDASSTVLIAPQSPHLESPIAGSLPSDISTLCRFFLRIHRTLEQQNRLILPLDPEKHNIVFSHIMNALVDHFVASGDLILLNSSPQDRLMFLGEWYVQFGKMLFFSNPFVPHNLAFMFTQLVLHDPLSRNLFIPAQSSFLHRDNSESSEQLLSAVKKVPETHSLEIVRDVYFDWKEWMAMMETLENDDALGTDLSFLQSRCLRSTLLSLQMKCQHIVHISHIEEQSLPVSVTDNLSTLTTHPPTEIEATWHLSVDDSSQSLTPHSNHSSSCSPLPTSNSSTFTIDFARHHSQRLLDAIHHHLARPQNTVFLWNIRPSESVDTSFPAPHPSFVDKNEKFDTSLFDETACMYPVGYRETDVSQHCVLDSFRSMQHYLSLTQSLHNLQSPDNLQGTYMPTKQMMRNSLSHSIGVVLSSKRRNPQNALFTSALSRIGSSRSESTFLFFTIADYLPTADDPRDPQFLSLQKAFRDGTHWEKVALVQLWGRWFFRDGGRNGEPKKASGFDFDGLLQADLTDPHLFDQTFLLIGNVITSDLVSMQQQWKVDFLLSFEKMHRMMSRLSSNPKVLLRHERSARDLRPLATDLGSLLSVFRGRDFPSALNDLITTDWDTIPHTLSFRVNPVFFLCHTSVASKHRISFCPMDLMFERYFRSDPDAFLRDWPDLSLVTSKQFLFTPSVGLHSILLRRPKFNLDQHALQQLVDLLCLEKNMDAARVDILDLFCVFPPPRHFDSLLSHLHLIRASHDVWVRFLNLFSAYGASVAPFGACSSLATIFQLLTPFDSNPTPFKRYFLRKVGHVVVSLHWLSIPAHFDSPLICHLPSLSGRQRDILQQHSSPSDLPCFSDRETNACLSVRNLVTHDSSPPKIGFGIVEHLIKDLLCVFSHHIHPLFRSSSPAIVSAAIDTVTLEKKRHRRLKVFTEC
ncbi:hypothetical protein BLNAU_3441 [Blattamonas nauphoetae]|uniref:Uncharacterized protein n=1 Tax=Blattamonas nauphoetae TaxID=2049346 RepID=A0ABQ9YD79_9EUKA|nr:hypothetical protein BLNAU_3441 [Blattamonas nauphoetae]